MNVRLIERGENAEQSREVPIRQSDFLIGRGQDCDLRLPASSVSRHHCMIRLESDGASVSDLGSANGTFVNGQRVRSQAALQSGDLLAVGTYEFVVDLGDRGDLWEAKDVTSTTLKLPAAVPGVSKPTDKPGTPPP